jgi:DNA polymerase III subunit epsilon
MNFVAIDVETANPDLASICQIGLVRFLNGRVADNWESLVDPEDYFDCVNISIHGINESAVVGSPIFPELSSFLSQQLIGNVVVCHTPFDRAAIRAVFSKYGMTIPEIVWLDTARVVIAQ